MVAKVHYAGAMAISTLFRPLSITGLLLAVCGATTAQIQIHGSGPNGLVRIFNTDSAILELQEPRQDLPCVAKPVKPFLGFDMRFHAGFEVSVPLKELAGSEDVLTMIFRVTSIDQDHDPVYFSQKYSIPAIERDAHGDAYLQGFFDLGEGRYHVDWLMRDRSERVCSAYWDMEAALPQRDRQLSLAIAPGVVQASEREPFKEEPPVERERENGPLNIKVLINFAPQNSQAATLQPLDINALVAILRSIAREPRIGRFSIVAFNMQEQRVVYRQENSEQIDFPAIGEALNSLHLGTIDLKHLSQKHGDTEFLTNLITEEVNSKQHPDALIFAGPKVVLGENVPQETLKQLGEPDYPVFYMNYNSNPQANPWRDAIGNTVKYFKGYEYTITRPRDLWFAWKEIMTRILSLRPGKRSEASASR